jgi:hypothetical protein
MLAHQKRHQQWTFLLLRQRLHAYYSFPKHSITVFSSFDEVSKAKARRWSTSNCETAQQKESSAYRRRGCTISRVAIVGFYILSLPLEKESFCMNGTESCWRSKSHIWPNSHKQIMPFDSAFVVAKYTSPAIISIYSTFSTTAQVCTLCEWRHHRQSE